MGATPSLNRDTQHNTEFVLSKENKLQKLLRNKEILPLTTSEYKAARMNAYKAVK